MTRENSADEQRLFFGETGVPTSPCVFVKPMCVYSGADGTTREFCGINEAKRTNFGVLEYLGEENRY